jgi:hypothetical protein
MHGEFRLSVATLVAPLVAFYFLAGARGKAARTSPILIDSAPGTTSSRMTGGSVAVLSTGSGDIMKISTLLAAVAAVFAVAQAPASAQMNWKLASAAQPGSPLLGFVEETVAKINSGFERGDQGRASVHRQRAGDRPADRPRPRGGGGHLDGRHRTADPGSRAADDALSLGQRRGA